MIIFRIESVNRQARYALQGDSVIFVGPAGSAPVHFFRLYNAAAFVWGFVMEPIIDAAIEHIRVMERRITKQEAAIERLSILREEASDAEQRLKLLRIALEEMRIQLAHLTPTAEQVAAPAWALPLVSATTDDTPSSAAV